MSDPQDIIADTISKPLTELIETNENCKKLHIDMLKCVTQNKGTHSCHEIIDKWHNCRTTEKILLNSFYDKTFKPNEK